MCIVEDETRGADASELYGVASRVRGVQGEAEADRRVPAKYGLKAPAVGRIYILKSRGMLFVILERILVVKP
jgi:hypothetical protein